MPSRTCSPVTFLPCFLIALRTASVVIMALTSARL